MKVRLPIALLCLFPLLAFGEPARPSDFDQLREQRPMIREYFESLLARNLSNQFANALQNRGFDEEQILKVINGTSFAAYKRNVLQDPRVEKSLDRFLNRLLAPGALEAMVQKKSLELAAQRQAAMALAVEELVRSQQRLLSREIVKPSPTLWERIWGYFTGDLF